MRRQLLIVAFEVAASGFVAAAVLGVRDYARERVRIAERLLTVRPVAVREVTPNQNTLRRLGVLLASTRIIGSDEIERLKQNLYAAGYIGRASLERFIGVKIALAAILLLAAFVCPQALGFKPDPLTQMALALGGAVVGLRGPNTVLASRAKDRREAMERALPDALDLLVVCAEAGIGLEVAFERVSLELAGGHPALASELAVTVSEMRLLPDRLQALHNMGERVRLDSVRSIASTLGQTLRYGTPLAKALRTLAADFRLVRSTKMEERAGRLPVLITVPMIAFILPATTLVVAGPAFLQLIGALGSIVNGNS